MIKKNKIVRAGGIVKTQILVVEGYRPAPGKSVKHRIIKNFGYQEDHLNQEAFWQEVNACNNELKANKEPIVITSITKNNSKSNRRYNYGYFFLKSVYDALDIKSFFDTIKFKGNYNLNDIFEFFVLQRVLAPDSKRATAATIQNFYLKDFNFKLHDVYNALTIIDRVSNELQLYIHDKVTKLTNRDTTYAYYDVTNYYTEIDFPEGEEDLRQKGVSKEHRLDPIIQMGLFLDNNSLPLAMSTFSGNTSDSITLQPIMKEIMHEYKLSRIIVVADKGINSSDNIDYICNNGNGYVFSQILKGKKGSRYHKFLFEEEGYTCNANKTYKYKTIIEEYEGKDINGKKIKRKRKVLFYWDKENADLESKKRKIKVEKAKKSLTNNAYSIKHSYERYIKEEAIITNTGEIAEDKIRYIDESLVGSEAMFDGYFCIITSELEYEAKKIREVYSQLWKIEETFKISKSDLLFRPLYVRSNSHIRAHFQICYVALLITRMFQQTLNEQISIERIQKVLNGCMLENIGSGIVHLHQVGGNVQYQKMIREDGKESYTLDFSDNDEIALDFEMIQKTHKINMDYSHMKQESFNKILKVIKYMTTK